MMVPIILKKLLITGSSTKNLHVKKETENRSNVTPPLFCWKMLNKGRRLRGNHNLESDYNL